jgi:ParB family chromosome partitioning protein
MPKSTPKLTLSLSRDIPLDRLELSQSNVRRVKAGVSIDALADDITRRGLLHGLSVRPILDETGQETGRYEVPAGGRRFRALGMLVKRKLLAKDAPVPCLVKPANDDILAEDDSLAENAMREALHPLDQFRAMHAMVEKGQDIEAVAANFLVTPAVVRQRLKLASVSPVLHDAYADDRIGLEQLMAFTISDDFERQVQVFELLTESRGLAPHLIRQKLTENVVRAADKRARFVTSDTYVEAGGGIARDLFEADGGGWLTDPALLDRLVDEKLKAEGEALLGEGWKWVATSVDLPWDALRDHREIDRDEVPMTDDEEARIAELEAEGEEIDRLWSEAEEVPDDIHARVDAINAEYAAIEKRPLTFAPEEIAIAGAFVSLERDGSIRIDRGYVRPEDEPVEDEEAMNGEPSGADVTPDAEEQAAISAQTSEDADDAEGAEELKPLPDRLVSDLTAWRTLALQDAFAQDPATAYLALLHSLVLGCFYSFSKESCLQVAASRVYFSNAPSNLRDCAPAEAIDARGAKWRERLPKSDKDVWDHLLGMGDEDRALLLAHCVSVAVNAQAEIVPKYDNGRISAHGVARRLAHSDILARAVGLDVYAAGWRPTEGGYFRSVTKPRIIADVTEARGENIAAMIDHLKKGDMAREAERLLEESDWIPACMRTPEVDGGGPTAIANDSEAGELPAFLADDGEGGDDAAAIAAE